jgi:tetratricopeptide (TPR) repeat protein
VLALLLATAGLAHADAADADLQREYDRIIATHRADPAVAAFADRVKLIQQVRDELNRNFEKFRSAALTQLLDDSLTGPAKPVANAAALTAATPKAKAPPPNPAATALDLLTQFGPRFSAALPLPPIAESDQAILRRYYVQQLRLAGAHIADRGRAAVAANRKDTFQLVGLSLVLPFLHTADDEWSEADIQQLPDWLTRGDIITQLESVSVAAARPLTAYQFARRGKVPASAVDRAADQIAYLRTTADRMFREQRHPAGITCLRTALRLTESSPGHDEDVTALHFRLAEVLSDTGQPALAADELALLLKRPLPDATFGKAAMLRTKYLYEAERFKDIVAIASTDERCAAYRPQLLYMTWVAARRADNTAVAEQMHKALLKDFPDHPLVADVYFAHAMESLAASDYDEAARVLEFIEFRFPQSRLIPKVKQIQQRLHPQPSAGKP